MEQLQVGAERLRTENIRDIMRDLGAAHIVDAAAPARAPLAPGRTALVVHFYYMDILGQYRCYLEAVPPEIDLILTTMDEERAATLRETFGGILAHHARAEVRVVAPRGRELSALLIGCRDIFSRYEYLGFLHDKKSLRDIDADGAVGAAFSRLLWENMLGGRGYIEEAVRFLAAQDGVGLLVPPPPTHGPYLAVSENFWTSCYAPACAFLREIGVDVPLADDVTPVSLGSAFWAKTAIFRKLLARPLALEDFPSEPMPIDGTFSHVLERIFPYLAQDAGFLTCYLMTEDYARREFLRFRGLYYALKRQHNRNVIQLDVLDRAVKERDENILKMSAEMAGVLEEKAAAERALMAARQEREQLRQKLQVICGSRSWRLTRPLRAITRWLRHIASF